MSKVILCAFVNPTDTWNSRFTRDGFVFGREPHERTFSEAKQLGFDLKTSAEFSDFVVQTLH